VNTSEESQPTVDSQPVVVDQRPSPPSTPARIVVTNDDGIESPGLRRLAARLAADFEVLVVAPNRDMSGSGTALGRFDPRAGVELTQVDVPGVATAYTVDGPPGLAVVAVGLGAFGRRPDLVVSGVNAGINTGHSVIHSGTVGAALTARTLGSHGLAVSVAESDPWQWDTAVEIARSAVDWVLSNAGSRVVLNLNVPAAELDDVRGIRWADLDEFGHLQVATADIPGSRLQFEVRGSASGLDPATDTALCLEGYATITLLAPVEPQPFPPIEATDIWRPTAADRA
jgi:5'-nucleotidase